PFDGAQIFGGLRFIGFSGVSGDLIFRRCHLHDISLYPFYFRGKNLILESNFIENCNGLYLTFNSSDINATIKHNTLVNTPLLDGRTNVSYNNVIIKNNILYGTAPTIRLNNIEGSWECSHNLQYNTAPSVPRRAADYPVIKINGTGNNVQEFVQNSYYFDPDFTTLPQLNPSSYAIGRAEPNEVRYAYNHGGVGADLFDAALPTIGCWSPVTGSKRSIDSSQNKIALVGDSITYGTGVSASDCYAGRLENSILDHVFIKMPGDPSRHLGIPGIWSDAAHFLAQEFAIAEEVEKVSLFIGVNDLAYGESVGKVAHQIIQSLRILKDLGVDNILYPGTPIMNPDMTSYDASISVEDVVSAYCKTNAIRYAKMSSRFVKINFLSNQAEPLYDLLETHPNSNGHEVIADYLQPLLISKYILVEDNEMLQDLTDDGSQGSYDYGLVVQGDNTVLDNIDLSSFPAADILIQGDNPVLININPGANIQYY
uniref:SGNH/GDSL hydrolase family protein n=1 Tax=Desulfosarcina cetonica TaxID=90730 RepID=UPI0012ED0073